MIRVTNRGLFRAQIEAWAGKARTAAEKVAVGMAYAALRNVTLNSPQYSGQFAASWNLSIGAPDYTYRQPVGQSNVAEAYQQGHPLPIGIALSANAGALRGFELGQTIFLANDVSHDEPYSFLIESNQINFRPVNFSKGRTLNRAYQYLLNRYSTIGRAQLSELIGV